MVNTKLFTPGGRARRSHALTSRSKQETKIQGLVSLPALCIEYTSPTLAAGEKEAQHTPSGKINTGKSNVSYRRNAATCGRAEGTAHGKTCSLRE